MTKTTDRHIESRAETEEKGQDNEHFQDKPTRTLWHQIHGYALFIEGLQQKKEFVKCVILCYNYNSWYI